MDAIDVRDLPEEQAQLVQEFVEFLRLRSVTPSSTDEAAAEQTWGAAAVTSFAKDWDNPEDALYDNWKEYYHVPKG